MVPAFRVSSFFQLPCLLPTVLPCRLIISSSSEVLINYTLCTLCLQPPSEPAPPASASPCASTLLHKPNPSPRSRPIQVRVVQPSHRLTVHQDERPLERATCNPLLDTKTKTHPSTSTNHTQGLAARTVKTSHIVHHRPVYPRPCYHPALPAPLLYSFANTKLPASPSNVGHSLNIRSDFSRTSLSHL